MVSFRGLPGSWKPFGLSFRQRGASGSGIRLAGCAAWLGFRIAGALLPQTLCSFRLSAGSLGPSLALTVLAARSEAFSAAAWDWSSVLAAMPAGPGPRRPTRDPKRSIDYDDSNSFELWDWRI